MWIRPRNRVEPNRLKALVRNSQRENRRSRVRAIYGDRSPRVRALNSSAATSPEYRGIRPDRRGHASWSIPGVAYSALESHPLAARLDRELDVVCFSHLRWNFVFQR